MSCGKVIVDDEAVLKYFKVQPGHLSGRNVDNHEKLKLG